MATELPGVADDGSADAVLAKDGNAEPQVAISRSRSQFTDHPSAASNTSAVDRVPKRKALLIGVQEIREGTSAAPEKPEEFVFETTDVPGCIPRGINLIKKRKKKDENSQTETVIGAHRDVEAMRELLKSMIFASFFVSSSGYSASTSLCRDIWL